MPTKPSRPEPKSQTAAGTGTGVNCAQTIVLVVLSIVKVAKGPHTSVTVKPLLPRALAISGSGLKAKGTKYSFSNSPVPLPVPTRSIFPPLEVFNSAFMAATAASAPDWFPQKVVLGAPVPNTPSNESLAEKVTSYACELISRSFMPIATVPIYVAI